MNRRGFLAVLGSGIARLLTLRACAPIVVPEMAAWVDEDWRWWVYNHDEGIIAYSDDCGETWILRASSLPDNFGIRSANVRERIAELREGQG